MCAKKISLDIIEALMDKWRSKGGRVVLEKIDIIGGTIVLSILIVACIILPNDDFLSCTLRSIFFGILGIIATIISVAVLYQVILHLYLHSKKFRGLQKDWKDTVHDFNDMNEHVHHLRDSYGIIGSEIDEGEAEFIDHGTRNYSRPLLAKFEYKDDVYHVSRQTVANSRNHPFQYVCKYAGIKPNEATLIQLEEVLEGLIATEQGQEMLQARYNQLTSDLGIPALFLRFSEEQIMKVLGIKQLELDNDIYFRDIKFTYTSAAGYSGMTNQIKLDSQKLSRLISHIGEKVKFRKSIAGQRALMTRELREHIKKRDNYTCRHCGNSIEKEPNLLLEIDHIKPLAKGGITTEDNLQVLCWRCNRTKGAKLDE